MFGNRTFNGTISERISEEPTVLIFPVTFFLIWILFLIWGALKGKNYTQMIWCHVGACVSAINLALESSPAQHLRALMTHSF